MSTNESEYFLNQLYRDFLLPEILGADNVDILYWAGKKIARKYQLDNTQDLPDFFQIARFGEITLLTEKKDRISFQLSGDIVSDRLDANSQEFSLEAGIIAQVIANQTGHLTETQFLIDKKKKLVQLNAVVDLKS